MMVTKNNKQSLQRIHVHKWSTGGTNNTKRSQEIVTYKRKTLGQGGINLDTTPEIILLEEKGGKHSRTTTFSTKPQQVFMCNNVDSNLSRDQEFQLRLLHTRIAFHFIRYTKVDNIVMQPIKWQFLAESQKLTKMKITKYSKCLPLFPATICNIFASN